MRHLLQELSRDGLFWACWCSLTIASAICTAFVVRPVSGYASQQWTGIRKASRKTSFSIAILALFLGAYATVILAKEDFAMYDNSQFTVYSIRGINLPVRIAPEDGRFWPLGLQEFNVIGRFTKSIAGYHAFSILELVVLALVLFNLDAKLRPGFRLITTIFAVTASAVAVSFTGLIFPERNIVLLLACLLLFIKLYEQTHSTRWAVAAIIVAQVMLYLKEPVFLLLSGFALARIALRIWKIPDARSVFERVWDKENRLDLCIVAVSMIFAASYSLMMFFYPKAQYLAAHRVPAMEALQYYASADLLVCTLAAVTGMRIYRIVRRTSQADLLWDGLACGGLIYFASYLAIGMTSSYYLAPVDLIAVLYLGHLLGSTWSTLSSRARISAVALGTVLFAQSLGHAAFHVLARKFQIRQKSAIAHLIQEERERSQGSTLDLYFPLATPYIVSEFAAYMSYRGLPVEEDNVTPITPTPIRIFSANIAQDGRCVRWRNFICHAGPAGSPNLVIVLPEDGSPPQYALYRKFEEDLFNRDPRIRPPRWISDALSFLWTHGAK